MRRLLAKALRWCLTAEPVYIHTHIVIDEREVTDAILRAVAQRAARQ